VTPLRRDYRELPEQYRRFWDEVSRFLFNLPRDVAPPQQFIRKPE